MKKMNPVVHFEMPAADRLRMAEFYKKVFGWQAKMLGEEMGNYVTVETTPAGPDGRPTMPGAINGGFFPVKPGDPAQYPSLVISVEDIKESAENVIKSGGKVLGEPVEIPGVGLYVSFVDTEGNKLSLLQPFMG
jgi:uncharacterized protein